MKAADLYLRYIAEFVDRGATRAAVRSQQTVRREASATGAALAATDRRMSSSGAVMERVTRRQQKEWNQVMSAARRADRETSRYALSASTSVPRSAVRQVEALRRSGQAYDQIAKQMRDHGHSATMVAATVDRALARETRAAQATARARQATRTAVGQAKGVAALGVGLGFAAAVRDTVQFDRSMRNVNSIAQLSEKSLGALQKQVLGLAGKTAQAPKTLADGLYDLVSSGVKAQDAIKVLGASAKAATAGLTTTEVSAGVVAGAINAYNLSARDAGHISDLLFQTVNRGVLTFEDLAQNIGPILPVASGLNVGLNQVGAALSTLTKKSIPVAEAATAITNAMRAFIHPSDAMKTALESLGVASGEQLLKQKGLQGALEALVGTTDGSKAAVQRLFPETRALNGALSLTGKNAKGARDDLAAFGRAARGATDRALAQQSKSIAYQWQQMKASAQAVGITIGQTLLPPLSKMFTFLRQHPEITKAAAALVAVGVAARAIRFVGALTGATRLLGVLRQVAAVKFGGMAGGAAAGAAGRAAAGAGGGGVAGLLSRLGLGRVSSLAKVAGGAITIPLVVAAAISIVDRRKTRSQQLLKDLDAVQATARQKVERINQEIAKVGDRPHAVTGGRTRRVNPLLNVEQDLKASLPALRAQAAKMDLASAFAAQAAKVRGVMGSLSQRTIQQLAKMRGPLRAQAAQAVVDVTRAMEGMGVKPVGSARKLAAGIQSVLGDMHLQAGRLSRATVRSVIASFGGLANALDGPFRHAQAKFLTFLRNMQSTADRVKNVANLTGLPGQGARRRKGGWNFAAGGFVPAMVSPGELIVHGNAGMVVPGHPVAADTVPMLLPTGSAVLTGHGQQLLAQGATISQAVAAQAPHFARGGFVKVGATVYNDPPPGAYGGSLSMGYAELGTARRTDGGGTGRGWLARALGRSGELPENYALRVSRRPDGAGRVAILRKRDRGYGQGGDGRTSDPYYAIDIWRDAWSNLGISGSFKGPVWVQPTTGKLPANTGGGGGGRSVSGLAQAMSRRVDRSAKRAGLVDDAFGSGFAQGEAGLTLRRLRYRPDTAARDIAAAYRLPASKTVGAPAAKAAAAGGGGAGSYGGARGPMVTWEGKRMRSWLAHALAYARAHGWKGYVNQGLRSHAEQVRLWNGAPGNGRVRGVSVARPGQSRHESGNAVDVSPPGPGLLRYFRGYRGMRPRWMGERDRVHFSDNGHRRGGWIGGVRPVRLRTGTGSVGGPVQVGRVIHQETTGPGIPSYGKRLQDALAKALTWQAGTFERLNQTVQRSAEAKLGALRNRLQAAVRKGGTEAAVKRLQAALDLVDKELGRRAGLLARRVTQRAASADRAQARSEIGLRLAGTDPESAPGLAARLRVEAAKGRGLHRTARDLGGELRLAQRAHDLERVSDLRSQIADNQTAILDSRATQRELARARQQALRDARTAFAAAMTDIASSRVQLSQTGLQRVELEQRLAGTYDTGGRQRADYITQSVIPQLQAERDQIKAQGVEAMRQNNAELARALRQAWEEKGNDILQALLDVKDATSQTATNTDPLRSLGGQLSFEFGGSRLTDDLLASSVGA